jgi:Domain of unknown function (DUF4440)
MLTLLLALALQAPSVAKEDTAVFAAQDARIAAMVAGNADYLETALDPSLTYHHSTGAAQTKAEFITAIREGKLKYKGLDVAERHVRRFGSVTIVTGIIHLQAVNNGEVIDSRARFTDVYEMKAGKFVQLAWQNTRIPQPTP